jgi:hypothetical protein
MEAVSIIVLAMSSVYIGFQMGKCAGARGFFLCLKQLSEDDANMTVRDFVWTLEEAAEKKQDCDEK